MIWFRLQPDRKSSYLGTSTANHKNLSGLLSTDTLNLSCYLASADCTAELMCHPRFADRTTVARPSQMFEHLVCEAVFPGLLTHNCWTAFILCSATSNFARISLLNKRRVGMLSICIYGISHMSSEYDKSISYHIVIRHHTRACTNECICTHTCTHMHSQTTLLFILQLKKLWIIGVLANKLPWTFLWHQKMVVP